MVYFAGRKMMVYFAGRGRMVYFDVRGKRVYLAGRRRTFFWYFILFIWLEGQRGFI